jgi:hypothetical protein
MMPNQLGVFAMNPIATELGLIMGLCCKQVNIMAHLLLCADKAVQCSSLLDRVAKKTQS